MKNNRAGIEERYCSAVKASNLSSEASDGGTTHLDVLCAAAWSKSDLGVAVLRLVSEFDGIDWPKAPTNEQINTIKASLSRCPSLTRDQARDLQRKASDRAWAAYKTNSRECACRLKSMGKCVDLLGEWAESKGIQYGRMKSASALVSYLDARCPTCQGRERVAVAGSPYLSGKVCHTCGGTGERPVTGGADVRLIIDRIKSAVLSARMGMSRGLSG